MVLGCSHCGPMWFWWFFCDDSRVVLGGSGLLLLLLGGIWSFWGALVVVLGGFGRLAFRGSSAGGSNSGMCKLQNCKLCFSSNEVGHQNTIYLLLLRLLCHNVEAIVATSSPTPGPQCVCLTILHFIQHIYRLSRSWFRSDTLTLTHFHCI